MRAAQGSFAETIAFLGSERVIEVHPSGYYLALDVWSDVLPFGPLLDGRLLSLLTACGCVAVAIAFARRLKGGQVGVAAGAMTGASAFLGWYATEVRMYALLAFLGALAMYLAALGEERRDARALVGAFAVAGLSCNAHYYGALTLVFLALWALRYGVGSLGGRLGGMAVGGLLAVPAAFSLASQLGAVQETPGALAGVSLAAPVTLLVKVFGFSTGAFFDRHWIPYVMYLLPLALLVQVANTSSKEYPPALRGLFAGLVFVPLLAFGGSLLLGVAMRPYPLLFLAPILSVFLAVGWEHAKRRLLLIGVIYWCIANLTLVAGHNMHPLYARPDIASALADIERSECDAILKVPEMLPGCGHYPFMAWEAMAGEAIELREACGASVDICRQLATLGPGRWAIVLPETASQEVLTRTCLEAGNLRVVGPKKYPSNIPAHGFSVFYGINPDEHQ